MTTLQVRAYQVRSLCGQSPSLFPGITRDPSNATWFGVLYNGDDVVTIAEGSPTKKIALADIRTRVLPYYDAKTGWKAGPDA
jgi:hypothetical protein